MRMRLPFLFFLLLFCMRSMDAQERQKAIESTRSAIEAECKQWANGDWNAWFSALKPYRDDLYKIVLASLHAPLPSHEDPTRKLSLIVSPIDPSQAVHANSLIPLAAPGATLEAYLADDRSKDVAVQLTSWLKARDIDLIVVPIPTKGDVYPELFVSNPTLAPASRIAGPQVRRKIVSHLDAGVEVLDVLPTFLKLRGTSPHNLYMAIDKHWNEHPQRATAELIAARLSRYPWVKKAQDAPARFTQAQRPYEEWRAFQEYLPPAPRRETGMWEVVPAPDSQTPVVSQDSPVLITGDSFVAYGHPVQAGLVGHTARLLNMPVSYSQIPGNVVQTFQDMFRNPNLLQGKRVVIWIMNYEPFSGHRLFPEKFRTPAVKPAG